MPLPVVQYPVFEIVIPSSKKSVKFRPFTVKEQKLLYQTSIIDRESILTLVLEIIKSCALDTLNVDSLKMFDVDYIFLNLRARSVNELVPANYICRKQNEAGEECSNEIKLELNLNSIEVQFPENYKEKVAIQISETLGMKLISPTVKQLKGADERKADSVFSVSDKFIFSCIECIYDTENVMVPGQDFTEEELAVFLETLPATVINKMNEFFMQNPFVLLKQEVKCAKCGNQEVIQLTNFESFFG